MLEKSAERGVLAAWTLEAARAKLSEWLDAESRIAKGLVVEIGDRRIRHVDADEVRRQIAFWRNEVDRLERLEEGKTPFQFVRTRFL